MRQTLYSSKNYRQGQWGRKHLVYSRTESGQTQSVGWIGPKWKKKRGCCRHWGERWWWLQLGQRQSSWREGNKCEIHWDGIIDRTLRGYPQNIKVFSFADPSKSTSNLIFYKTISDDLQLRKTIIHHIWGQLCVHCNRYILAFIVLQYFLYLPAC